MLKKGLILYNLVYLISLKILVVEMAARVHAVPIRVGVVMDTNDCGEMAMTCLSMALSDFYATHAHYKTRITLINRDPKGGVIGPAAAALDLIKNVRVQAIIGPTYSYQARFVISLGQKAHVPIITFSATSPSLSSIPTPYFIRATLNDSSQVGAIAAIVKAFGWREVVLIYEGNEFGEGIIPYLTDALEDINARVPYRSVISTLATDDQIVAELYKLMTMQTRVFVVHLLSPLASSLFTKAKQLGMMSSGYSWIITNSITSQLNTMDPKVKQSMLGAIGVKPHTPNTKELDDFEIRFKRRVQQSNPNVIAPEMNDFLLWAYDSVIALAVAAEQAKLINPKYIETNSSANITDLEAFGISDAGPKLIQALSNTKFKGLSGEFQFVNGQLQAPAFEIINMVGPGAQVIGYWTKENGIVKELSSNSPNMDTNSISRSNLRTIMWPGDSSSLPKGWVIPTNGKKLRVGIPVKNSFTDLVHVAWNSDNSTSVEGYCIDVFDAVMSALPYGLPYEYIPFAAPDHTMAGSYNDLTCQVYYGNYDVVAGDVAITANRSKYVDFSLPYMPFDISMVVPFKDDKRNTAWVFLKPLTWELWLTSFCSFVFIGFLIWILEHRINEDFRGPLWHQVGIVFWFAFSTMVFAHKEKVISNLARLVLVLWFFVVLILTQSYTASLASMLTIQKLIPSVTDVHELIKNNEKVGYQNGSFVYELLKETFHESQLVSYNTSEHMDDLLSKGSGKGGVAAIIHKDPYLKLFLRDYSSRYMMVGPVYKADGFGFVFPKNSPLVADVSRAILHVTKGPKIAQIERKWLGNIGRYSNCNTLSTTPKNLSLASFLGLFMIIGIAGISTFIIYMVKFLCENRDIIEGTSTAQRKIEELLQSFKNKDLNCHTFKNVQRVDVIDDSYRSGQSSYSSPFSLHTGGLSSCAPSSPTTQQGDERCSADNIRISEQGGSSETINQEIELCNQDKYTRETSNSAQGRIT